jgi:hypothetical protein
MVKDNSKDALNLSLSRPWQKVYQDRVLIKLNITLSYASREANELELITKTRSSIRGILSCGLMEMFHSIAFGSFCGMKCTYGKLTLRDVSNLYWKMQCFMTKLFSWKFSQNRDHPQTIPSVELISLYHLLVSTRILTFSSTDALDSIADLHIVVIKRHEDPVRCILPSRFVYP